MALYADRVKQSLGITGTGTVTLTLATTGTGYQSFLAAFGTGTQTVAYCIADQSGPNWEVGTGAYNGSANTLARTTVLASSNGGSLTNFSGGTQEVFCTAPAKYLDTFTSTNQGTVPASGGGTTNFLRADGTFAAPPATAPAGSDTQIQYNNAGAFGASANFTYATGTNTFTVGPAGATTTIETLAPTGATVAGTLRLRGKNASAANGAGGGLQFTGGNALGTGTAGGFTFSGGTSGATGGSFTVLTGQGTGVGGEVKLESGNGTGAAGTGGRFFLNAGAGIGDGGAFEMNGGQATNGTGGGYLLQSGFSINGAGGDFQFIALGGPLGNGQMYFDTDSGGTVIQLTATTGGDPQLGFYGTVPVSQAAAYTKTYATASRIIPNATFTNLVTTAATNVTPYGFATQAQADAIATKVNALAADVLILKQLIVSLVNDSSTTLGVGLNAT